MSVSKLAKGIAYISELYVEELKLNRKYEKTFGVVFDDGVVE